MPKRSNAFQQLIYSIQHGVSKESTVTESKFLIDRDTDEEVEVDIVIESAVDEFPVIVSVEVRDRTRPATIEWVRESIGKHATLPTNKLILVSRTGFTKQAVRKARENGIETLSLEEADDYSWSEAINAFAKDGIILAAFSLSWQKYIVEYTTIIRNGKEIIINQDSLGNCIFTNSTNGTTKKLGDVPGLLLSDGNVARPIMQKWIKDKKEGFEITCRVPQGSTLTDEFGNIFELEFIKVIGKSKVKREPIKFTFSKFNNTKVAHASVNDIVSKVLSGGEVTVIIIDRDEEAPLASIILPQKDELGRRVLAMQLV